MGSFTADHKADFTSAYESSFTATDALQGTPGPTSGMLLEDGSSYLLLESGDYLLLEDA